MPAAEASVLISFSVSFFIFYFDFDFLIFSATDGRIRIETKVNRSIARSIDRVIDPWLVHEDP